MTQTTVKKPSARESLHLFTNIFDVKKRTDIHSVGDEKSKHIETNLDVACGQKKTERSFKNQQTDQT